MPDPSVLPTAESLTIEFKSDRTRLPDDDLIGAVIAMANTSGGTIYIGVENDGTPAGLHPKHDPPDGLLALVANRTVPSVQVTVERLLVNGIPIAKVEVARANQIVASTGGVFLRRRLKHDGTPENVPLLPHDVPSRLSQLGVQDVSRQPIPNALATDLDPLERGRLRRFIERTGGEPGLMALSDDELDGVLGFTLRDGTASRVTLSGLLMIGHEESLRRLVPTYEVAFQVLEREDVRVNEFSRGPLVRVVEWLEANMAPWNREEEIQVGLFRVAVPVVERRAFREAIANALIHRDYTRTGAVHVRLQDDTLTVSNPGGFVEGVTVENLLTTEPRPRNPWLADVLKRLGLVERTGRGVDLIYRGVLQYGRARPDYTQSNSSTVALRLPVAPADLAFLRLITEEENRLQAPLPIDSLIALSLFREQRRVTRSELQHAIQKDEAAATRTLEVLRETGLVQSHGRAKGTTYTLSSRVYALLGTRSEYVRQAGFAAVQQEQMVARYILEHGQIARAEVMDLCGIGADQAKRLLQKLVAERVLLVEGTGRWRRYRLAGNRERSDG